MLLVHTSLRPMEEERHPVSAVVFATLLTSHSGVENLPTARRAVVRGKDKYGIFMGS